MAPSPMECRTFEDILLVTPPLPLSIVILFVVDGICVIFVMNFDKIQEAQLQETLVMIKLKTRAYLAYLTSRSPLNPSKPHLLDGLVLSRLLKTRAYFPT